MIIEKGTRLRVNSQRRGVFIAVARRSFSTEDQFYPLTVVDPLDSNSIMQEEVMPNSAYTEIEIADTLNTDPTPVVFDDVTYSPAVTSFGTEPTPVVFNPNI